jgi:hypothetical protein
MKGRAILLFSLLPMALLTGGCSEEQQEAVEFRVEGSTREALIEKRTAYFKEHQDERLAARKICQSTPKEQRDEELERECIAVFRAQ